MFPRNNKTAKILITMAGAFALILCSWISFQLVSSCVTGSTKEAIKLRQEARALYDSLLLFQGENPSGTLPITLEEFAATNSLPPSWLGRFPAVDCSDEGGWVQAGNFVYFGAGCEESSIPNSTPIFILIGRETSIAVYPGGRLETLSNPEKEVSQGYAFFSKRVCVCEVQDAGNNVDPEIALGGTNDLFLELMDYGAWNGNQELLGFCRFQTSRAVAPNGKEFPMTPTSVELLAKILAAMKEIWVVSGRQSNQGELPARDGACYLRGAIDGEDFWLQTRKISICGAFLRYNINMLLRSVGIVPSSGRSSFPPPIVDDHGKLKF